MKGQQSSTEPEDQLSVVEEEEKKETAVAYNGVRAACPFLPPFIKDKDIHEVDNQLEDTKAGVYQEPSYHPRVEPTVGDKSQDQSKHRVEDGPSLDKPSLVQVAEPPNPGKQPME